MDIESVDHVGLRVCDAERSVTFYERLGFQVVYRDAAAPVVILRNGRGVELNLIVNGPPDFDGKNRLMDVAEKYPGYTHVALRVPSIESTVAELGSLGIEITEGPKQLGPGLSLFIRDPDANVIELRQTSR